MPERSMLSQKQEQTMESLTLYIKVQRSGTILVMILSFCRLNILRKRSNQTLQQAISTY